jgi:uncharacterized protein
MEKAGCARGVLEHVKNVTCLALKIADQFIKEGYDVNRELIEAGAILHDLGRSRTHGVEHGVVGGSIARDLNLPEPIIRIIERHVGAGIPPEEALKLGLPLGNYEPKTIEEKIVTYADKLIEGDRVIKIEVTIEQFKQELGKDHPAIHRLEDLHREIQSYIGSQNQTYLRE